MIVDLPDTSVGTVSKKLIQLRDEVGAMALGRVLTLVIVIDEGKAETALEVAGDATRQHPSRIVCIVTGNRRGANRIDAQIRVGGDAGASEVVVLRLYGELTKHGEAVVLQCPEVLQQLVPRQHQLRNRGHQLFEQRDRHADRLDAPARSHIRPKWPCGITSWRQSGRKS